MAGAVTSQGDHAQRSDLARSNYGVSGAGVKVGVLADSFNLTNPATASYPGGDNAAADSAGGDLPAAGVQVIQESSSGGSDEGRAMLQIIHDIAPNASLLFATSGSTQATFASNILALAAAGAKIIVDNTTFFDELAYQDGPIAQAINQVATQGVIYFAAAGPGINNGHNGYEGAWVDGGAATIGTTQGGSISEHFMQFAPGQNYMTINLQLVDHIVLQWSRPANSASGPSPGAGDDLDLFITNAAGDRIFQQSIAVNTNGDPVEVISLTALAANQSTGINYLRVGLFSGTAPSEIKVIAYKNTLGNALASNLDDGTIYGHAAADGAIAVGAAAFSQTPDFGVSPPGVESFSASGPTKVMFDVNGNLLSTPSVRQTPSITAPDGGNNTFFGSDSATDADSFPNYFGTGAAAAHAAGVAALMLEVRPMLTSAEVKAFLMHSAVDMDNPATAGFDTGVDAATGAGLINADIAVALAIAGPNDFNPDGKSDLLWRHTGGTFTEWQSTGNGFTPNVVINSTVDNAWHSEGTFDFSGDGRADLIWRNDASGQFTIWNSTGSGFTPNSFIGNGVDTTWKVAALADFNGDGWSDILWRHASGTFTEWQSTGNGFTVNAFVGTGVDNTWHLAAAADFSGDGKADLLWRNDSGQFTEWQSTGNGFTPNVVNVSSVDPTWHILGTGDFNGDGKTDLLFRHNNGTFTEWQSTGNGFTPNVFVTSSVNNSWHLAQVGDFNADGKDDLLWRNDNGTFTEWQSTGNSFTPNVVVNGTVGTDWALITHHYDLV
jgi:hypothetical protein